MLAYIGVRRIRWRTLEYFSAYWRTLAYASVISAPRTLQKERFYVVSYSVQIGSASAKPVRIYSVLQFNKKVT